MTVWMKIAGSLLVVVLLGCSGGGGDADVGTSDAGSHETGQCVPDCQATWCGNGDGCGGICTTCPANSTCSTFSWTCDCPGPWCEGNCCLPGQACEPGGTCEGQGCTPACDGKWCGADDGCGGKCTRCPQNAGCDPANWTCDCAGTWCGGDCCLPGQTCGPDETCQGQGCTPDCAGKWCGDDDGCGGKCKKCPTNSACNTDSWSCDCPGDWCGGNCCLTGEECGPDQTCQTCVPDCAGKDCGDDGCGGVCGICGTDEVCIYDQCTVCIPQCAGMDCGDDGCGGICGTCEPGKTCVLGKCQDPPKGGVGGPCTADYQCTDPGASCYPEAFGEDPTGFINGYCLVYDCSAGSCPVGSDCFPLLEGGGGLCMATCDTVADCPQQKGYGCIQLSGLTETICWPDCTNDADCPDDAFCDQGDQQCVPDSLGCSVSNPFGYCPGDLVCQGGECKPYDFTCTDQTMEPNETIDGAKTVNEQVTNGLQICSDDEDWFKLTIPAGHVGTLGMYFVHKLGDLDLCAFESDGTFLGCRYPFEDYPANWRTHDWNDEYLTALAAVAPRTLYFKGDGWNGAVNEYQLTVKLTQWKDGDWCQDHYSAEECAGCDPDTGKCQLGLGKVNLIQFPYPDPGDPYVGEGYILEHASGYNFLRRELIMHIRYAIKAVQDKFPGTKPLGLMDMCQIDGITPGFDVGDPRHPESTHDQGGNIDVAYYQTGPNNEGKIVCDGMGGSNDGYYCTSVDNHVVDLPRTAYFLARLAESSRLRVYGLDVLLAPLILAELKAQKDKGWISESVYNNTVARAAYGSGWSFHHHHIHVSFKWWSQGLTMMKEPPLGCGFRMEGDGPWPMGIH